MKIQIQKANCYVFIIYLVKYILIIRDFTTIYWFFYGVMFANVSVACLNIIWFSVTSCRLHIYKF